MKNDAMTDTAYTAPAAATPGPASPSPSFGPLTSPEPGAKTAWPIQYIPIKDIEYGERLRPLDPAEVDRKAESIAQIGLLQAITVARHPSKMVEGSNPPRPVYVLQAGLHRTEACKKLNWEMIPAHVTTLDGAYARLVEVDENLCRAELDAAMRAKFTNERKAIYEALYPETAKGKAQGEGKRRAVSDSKIRSEIDTPAPKQKSFVEDTADKTGRSKSTIALEAERGDKIADDVLDALAGTPHAKGYALDELKRLTYEQQRERVKELQAAPQPKAKPKSNQKLLPKGAKLTMEEKKSSDLLGFNKNWEPFAKVWNEACLPARREYIEKVAWDLGVDIHFAGEVIKGAPTPLAANGAPAEVRANA